MLDRFGRPKTSIGDAGAVACILNPNAITAKNYLLRWNCLANILVVKLLLTNVPGFG
ncbi:MAG: hypothetical protein CM1200mP6_08120 [Anaerolineaceae bacterium]|nr:MAG: hypothetical protein CM1200mP6_08120 [Anaerolineaceae bacterium]